MTTDDTLKIRDLNDRFRRFNAGTGKRFVQQESPSCIMRMLARFSAR